MKSRSELRLGDACEKIGSGATPRGGKNAYQGGRFALVRSQNVYNHGFEHDGLAYINDEQAKALANAELRANDVLMNITGDSVARCCQIDPAVLPARVNQHVAIIRTDQRELDARFLRYKLISPEIQHFLLAIASAGGTRNALTKAHLENLEIDAPPVPEQRAIARILGSLDDKIELNRRMNRTLESMARALFKSWFIDFSPVHANAAGKPILFPEIAALFPSRFQDSELGVIPEGWRVTALNEVTHRVTKGDTPRSSALAAAPPGDRMVNMLRVNAIAEDGEILHDKLVEIPESIHLSKSKRSILKANYILYTNAGTIGRVALVDDELLPANTNQAIAIIQPNEKKVSPKFLYMVVRQPEFQTRLHYDIVHAVQANLGLGKISDATFVMPPKEIIDAFMMHLDKLLDLIRVNRRESSKLTAMRDALLPKLLSGELAVASASEAVA